MWDDNGANVSQEFGCCNCLINESITYYFGLRVYPDAPRLEPLSENGAQEQDDSSDRESEGEEEPSSTKKKRVVLKRNFRRPSRESKERADPLKE